MVSKTYNSIPDVLEDVKKGKPIIIIDSEQRENEGDLMIVGENVSETVIAFMIKEGSGLMCLPVSEKIAEEKGIKPITTISKNRFGCNFGIPVDSKETTTGVSALDRTKTIKALCNPNSKPEDFFRPGHLFPLIAKNNGVLERDGHTEAAIDLCKASRMKEMAVICEIIKENGEMARLKDLEEFKEKFGLKMISIEQLIEFRRTREDLNPRPSP